ncbi:MAG: hypothetical protein A2W86_06080 [Bacteroidetes bacterium GWD2_45_23]|nr:MAG: hypothetical protein A2W87_13315 [Bacteroidetes bacterium GWC2_46_850]OFX75390.1 MAG: hypothetical protein A2071_05025 [Bacteroidetes bacterium GWC1_47_7]OFX87716.1 MAG: hypothetical protein A2W86_06080 [Bacteroidetes bacterium GWD2_45_23]HBB01304.1 hypothetical protein [Porphyromonadaceae bacterium]HCC19246.1 hypothetical protein [Porphyromonadaceae bacterium]
MKSFRFIQLATVLLLFTTAIKAGTRPTEKLYIESSRFAIPLIEKWASEYEKANPGIEIVLTGEKTSGEAADLSLVSFGKDGTFPASQPLFYTGRYALLPVTNEENPLLDAFNRKGLNSNRLKELFFEKDGLEIDSESAKEQKHDVIIYSGNNANSFSASFSAYFGHSPVELKGKKISGDDIFLIHAVQNDHVGVTFNNLSYLFDIETRKLKEGLALIPLDVRKEQREVLKQADMDQTIALLEREQIQLIPVLNFGFIYRNDNSQAQKFLTWILSEGQQYNKTYGFLPVEDKILAAQLKEIDNLAFTASTN